MDDTKVARVAEELGCSVNYLEQSAIDRIAAILDELDALQLALTAIRDKAVVDWDDETVGNDDEPTGLTWEEATCGTAEDIHKAEWGY